MLSTSIAIAKENTSRDIVPFIMPVSDPARVRELTTENTAEVQAFLAIRPVHTVVMASFIVDNGVESELNRGKFYGYRGVEGKLEGVALIGHSTLVEARSDEALKALAVRARQSETPIHLIMSSGADAERFWLYYTGGARTPRLTCTEALFEVSFPYPVQKCEWEIGTADINQLALVAEAQAEIAFVECGIDPMLRDRIGFLKRVARRIEKGRVFTVYSAGKLIFKADIIAETPDTIYLEGVYVHPDHRGQGVGSRCLAALTLKLLGRSANVCLLSNVDFADVHKAYYKAGFSRSGQCTTLFV